MLQFERTFEQEADTIAVKLTSTAGYDPQALLRYMNRVWPDNQPDPVRTARIAAIETAIQQLSPANSGDDFLRIQKQVRDTPQN